MNHLLNGQPGSKLSEKDAATFETKLAESTTHGELGLETSQKTIGDGTVTSKAVYQKLQKQSFKCALTGADLTPQTAALDHIVPISGGGTHTIDNVWVIDQQVNAAKGSMPLEEFVAMCQAVADWTRR
jgi:hypothetical protein